MVTHDDELHIDEEIARRLIAEQFLWATDSRVRA